MDFLNLAQGRKSSMKNVINGRQQAVLASKYILHPMPPGGPLGWSTTFKVKGYLSHLLWQAVLEGEIA
jgi:hypothetical protein